MFLSVENLTAHYGRVKALDGVTMQAEKGAIVTLIGANGAGKSSFMMCLSGVLRPTSGTIEFDGRRIERAWPEEIVAIRQFAELSAAREAERLGRTLNALPGVPLSN